MDVKNPEGSDNVIIQLNKLMKSIDQNDVSDEAVSSVTVV